MFLNPLIRREEKCLIYFLICFSIAGGEDGQREREEEEGGGGEDCQTAPGGKPVSRFPLNFFKGSTLFE